jgi:large subunit ribosomal protein L20
MTRVKRGYVARRRRNRQLDQASGFRGAHSTLYRTAYQQNMKALRYQTRDRKTKKRLFRSLWITRISAGARIRGAAYSTWMAAKRLASIDLNRKVLSQLACLKPSDFTNVFQST